MAQLQQVLREPVAAPVLSPEDVRRRRQIALEMQNAGMQTTPVQHWTQGLARVAQALAGQYEDAQATKAEEEGRSSARRSIAELLAPQAPDAPSQAPEARIGQIMSAMDNPWLGEGQRAALTQMAGSAYKDPRESKMLDLQLTKAEREIGQIGQPAPTEMMRNYDAARASGFPGSFVDYQNQFGRAPSTTINLGGDNAFEKGVGQKQAELFVGLTEAGMNAKSDMADISKLRELTATNPGGLQTGLTQIASEYGIKLDGSSNLEAASAIINRLVPAQRQPGSGPMSDRDVELFKASLPRLMNTPQGNKIILDTMEGLARYKAAQAEIASAVVNGEVDRKEGAQRLMALPNPLDLFRNSRPSTQGQRQDAPVSRPVAPRPSPAPRPAAPARPAAPSVPSANDPLGIR